MYQLRRVGRAAVSTVVSAMALAALAAPVAQADGGTPPPPPVVTTDTTAPKTWAAPLPALTRAPAGRTTITLRYNATDPSGVASYDVRYHVATVGGPTTPWVYPASWQATTAVTQHVTGLDGRAVCFAIRARDTAGNLSPWTASRCTTVDGTAPREVSVSLPTSVYPVKHALGKNVYDYFTSATLRWSSRDRDVTAYEVQSRGDCRDIPSCTWTAWDSSGWHSARTVSKTWTLHPAEEECARVRARDAAGNVGPWSSTRCVVAAMTEVDFLGSLTKVSTAGGSQYVMGVGEQEGWIKVHARVVKVRVLTSPQGGSFDVYAGTTKVGHVRTASSSTRWTWLTVQRSSDAFGALRLKATGQTWSRVSHVAVWS